MSEETLSSAALDRLREWGGDKLVRQMIRLFLENAVERRQQIQAGLPPDGDLDHTERGAHSLKSGAANLGAMKVSRTSARLEEAAEKRDRERSLVLARELEHAMDEVEPLLREIMEGIEE